MLLAEGVLSRFGEIVFIIRITIPVNKVSLGHKLICTHDLDLVHLLHTNFDPEAVVASANQKFKQDLNSLKRIRHIPF